MWDEASRQAQDMVASWSRKGSEGTEDTVGDNETLTSHVLNSAGVVSSILLTRERILYRWAIQ